MTNVQALALGLVQGLTEFLPVSSSGHLILASVLLGWPDQGLAFDAAVHLGTALALVGYFGRELATASLRGAPPGARRTLMAAVVVGSVPAGLAGLLLGDVIEASFRDARIVAVALIGWGLVLWWADRRAARARVRGLTGVGLPRALLIGCAQALALVPGTSRSGITITAGLVAGLDRPTAARFGFLLGLPITAAAGVFETGRLVAGGLPGADAAALAIGLVGSLASGLVAVWFLVRYLERRTLAVFVAYRIALGLTALWLA